MVDILCACCGRPTIPGLSHTQEAILRKLATATEPQTVSEIVQGLPTDATSFHVQITALRSKLAPHGFLIANVNGSGGGKQKRGRYRLERSAGT